MVQQIRILKCNAYKNNDDKGGAMLEAIKQCPADEVVFHIQTKKNGRVWGHTTPKQLLTMLEKNNGVYEVITKYPHKVYFDVDKKDYDITKAEAYLQEVKQIIEQFFPTPEYAVSGSITEKKTSYHIVLNNYTIHNEEDREKVKHITHYIRENIDEGFDWTVYTKNRNMKAINQSKIDGRVQAIIENDDFKKHLITCFVGTTSLPFNPLPEAVQEKILIAKSKKTFNLGELPKLALVLPNDVNLSTITADEVLSLLPNSNTCNFTYRHLVMRFCHTNGVAFEKFLAWIWSRFTGTITQDKVSQWTNHWSNAHKFPPASIEKMKPVLIYFYPHINKDKSYRDFNNTFELGAESISKIERLSPTEFNGTEKYSLFNIGMGGGKTAQTIDYLKHQQNFIWVCPNRALSINTKKRLNDAHIECSHYESFNSKEKKEGILELENRLIIVLNSLHYIGKAKYSVVVIDEIETLLDKFQGDFMDKAGKKKEIWNAFVNILKSADKVLLLDAFITTKTINFIKSIENSQLRIYERIKEPNTRTVNYMKNFPTMVMDMCDKLKQGKKIFVFYPYKETSGSQMSMKTLVNILMAETNTKGVHYNADVCDKIKKGLADVNTSWANMSFVITNAVITCGVNYEVEDFDCAYLCIASFCCPRDLIQVSYRARYLATATINVCFLGKMSSPVVWKNDTAQMNDENYTALINSILVEMKSPLKRTFQLFCSKAHYKQKMDDTELNNELKNYFDKLLEANIDMGFSYDTIEDIVELYKEDIEQFIFKQEATMYQKVCLQKYYFKRLFKDEALTETIAYTDALKFIWDSKYTTLVKQVRKVLNDKENLFVKIMEANKLDSIFGFNPAKMKLTPELIDRIFTEFTFKFISKSSSHNKIIKEIYNNYFGKNIVETNYANDGDKGRANYEIQKPNELFELETFCAKCLFNFDDKVSVISSLESNAELNELSCQDGVLDF